MKNQKNTEQLVSVVMPVYNAEKFLKYSIESILNQSYKNFEFIIIDDASTDASFEILKAYKKKDKRIHVIKNLKNEGVSRSVKKTIDISHGRLLARMDADDIATPDRLEKQVSYLTQHPETVAIGGQCITIDTNGSIIGQKTFPTDYASIYRYIFTFIPLQQPSLMIARGRLPKDFEFYYDGMNTAEEVELIFKLFQYGKVENLPDFIHYYRIHSDNTSFKDIRKTFYLTLLSRMKAIVIYKYTPHALDICINLAQLAVVTFLPRRATLKLYQYLRHINMLKAKHFVAPISVSSIPSTI